MFFGGLRLLRVGVDAIVSAVQRFTYGQRVVYYKGSVRHICVVVAYEDRDTGAIIKVPRVLLRGAGIVKPVAESRLSPFRHSWRTSVMPRPKRATLVLNLFFSHRRVLYGGQAAAEIRSTKCSPTASSNDLLEALMQVTEKEDCRATPSSPFMESRCATWDDDLRRVNEELSASARMVDMEVMRSHLSETGRHAVCAQAPYSFKPSVKARASKLKKRIVNRQKQMRRRMQKRVGIIPQKNKCCLVSAFRGLGIKVPYAQDGPFWVLKDGSEMLRPFGYSINPEARLCTTSPGRWLICRDGHCTALHRKGKGDTWIIDGADRKQVADCELDKCVKGAAIYRVPVVDVAYDLESVIPIVVCLCQMFSL